MVLVGLLGMDVTEMDIAVAVSDSVGSEASLFLLAVYAQ